MGKEEKVHLEMRGSQEVEVVVDYSSLVAVVAGGNSLRFQLAESL